MENTRVKSKPFGIYCISDVETGNCYVGSVNENQGFKKRFSNHLSNFRGNKHRYPQLQEAWNDNPDRIKFEYIEECESGICEEDLEELEKFYMDYFNKVDGITVINKKQHSTKRTNHTVSDTSKMKAAQKGEGNGNAKLLESEVRKIRELNKSGSYTNTEIASQFGITASHVYNIINYNTWTNID